MAEIRFTRSDYNKLVSEDFYSVKRFPNYEIYEENTNKKVAIWTEKEGGVLKYNKSKSLISWLSKNSYLPINESFGLIGTEYIDKTTEPEAVLKIQEIVEEKFKDFKIIGKYYVPGDTMYKFVFETSLDDIIEIPTELSRPKLITKMNEFKSDLSGEISGCLNLVGVNVMSYQFAKNENKLRFSVSILLSRTRMQQWENGKFLDL